MNKLVNEIIIRIDKRNLMFFVYTLPFLFVLIPALLLINEISFLLIAQNGITTVLFMFGSLIFLIGIIWFAFLISELKNM